MHDWHYVGIQFTVLKNGAAGPKTKKWKCSRCSWSVLHDTGPDPGKTLELMEMVWPDGRVDPGCTLDCDGMIVYKVMET